MSKFTPGPWVVTENGNCFDIHTDNYNVARVQNIGNEDNQANANLIKASPELYEAALIALAELVEVRKRHAFTQGVTTAITTLLSALTSAEGK